jgi:hypothetical protein
VVWYAISKVRATYGDDFMKKEWKSRKCMTSWKQVIFWWIFAKKITEQEKSVKPSLVLRNIKLLVHAQWFYEKLETEKLKAKHAAI